MVYTEIRRIKGRVYYYRAVSVRKNGKIAKERVYLGSGLGKSELSRWEKIADKRLLSGKTTKAARDIKEIKSKIIGILSKNRVNRAGIFGSYARGEQKRTSDVDIVVNIDDKRMSLLGFIRLNRQLEGALKRKVDLVEYSAIKPGIKERISKEEVRII